MLVKDNGEPVTLDFGVAILPLSRPGEIPVPGGGTPVFIAVEQLTGRPVSPKAGLYALATAAPCMRAEAKRSGGRWTSRRSASS